MTSDDICFTMLCIVVGYFMWKLYKEEEEYIHETFSDRS